MPELTSFCLAMLLEDKASLFILGLIPETKLTLRYLLATVSYLLVISNLTVTYVMLRHVARH